MIMIVVAAVGIFIIIKSVLCLYTCGSVLNCCFLHFYLFINLFLMMLDNILL